MLSGSGRKTGGRGLPEHVKMTTKLPGEQGVEQKKLTHPKTCAIFTSVGLIVKRFCKRLARNKTSPPPKLTGFLFDLPPSFFLPFGFAAPTSTAFPQLLI